MHPRTRPNALIAGLVLLFVGFSAMAQRTATAIPTVVNGFVVAITVTDGGSGYSTPPTVTITGGGGTAAAATATVLNGAVGKVIVSNAGSGYTGSPSITIAAPPSPKPPLSDGLVAYYPFNGNANDESGNGDDAYQVNAALSSDRYGLPNSAYYFDGSPQTGIKTLGSTLPTDSSARTISLWIKPDDLTLETSTTWISGGLFQYGTIIPGGGTCQGQFVWQSSPSLVSLYLGTEDSWGWDAWLAGWNFSQWHHVLWTYGGDGSASVFVDGRKEAFESNPPAGVHFRTGKGPLSIGTAGGRFFRGQIDDVRIYSRAFSEQEVNDLYWHEFPAQPWVSIAVQTVVVTLHVKPTRKYQLEASFDLKTWTKVGEPIFAASPEIPVTANVLQTGQFFRVYEVQ